MPVSLTVPAFVAQWKSSHLTEISGYQQHFLDLCRLLGEPTPAQADPVGTWYTFQKGITKTAGSQGFADVWKRGYFAWEYKGKHKDLGAAYQQLLKYREDLENPPLLIVCDFDRFEIHTNYTNTLKEIYKFSLADLNSNQACSTCKIPPVEVLRAVFNDP